MPVWHKATQRWIEDGRLALIGIIQEQHSERCRLFAQWHEIGWPILHDPINVLNTTAVPMFIAIDEHGIVRSTRARLDDFEETFLNRTFADNASNAAKTLTPPPSSGALQQLSGSSDGQAARLQGDSLATWHLEQRVDEAIAAYETAVESNPQDLASHFRLGVCLLNRHESEQRHESDFQRAVHSWETALAGRPNQYIWRRRIQQYGPRLMKPYPFYDWVTRAEADIRARDETPIELRISPSGAEIARPAKQLVQSVSEESSPDPQGRIHRDEQGLIETSVTTVPSIATGGSTVRVHVTFVPNAKLKAHWNNESEPLQLWVNSLTGATIERQLLSTPAVPYPQSNEVRRLDFEVELPSIATSRVALQAYALYYVCEDVDGLCMYLRKDIPIEIRIAE